MNKIYVIKTNVPKSELSKTAYSLLSDLLFKDFGIQNPTILKTDKGKPYLKDQSVYFNISHTDGAIAIAFSDNEVGIDIEQKREADVKIARRFFTQNEAEYVENSADKTAEFLKLWTKKEAYIKMLGEGISLGLNTFDVISDDLSKKIKTFEIEGFYVSVCSNVFNEFEIFTTTI